MRSKRANSPVVGLDIENSSVAASEVRVNGKVEVTNAGVAELESGIVREGEVQDPDALAATLKSLFAEHKLPADVRIGVANQRVVVRTMSVPRIADAEEFEKAIRFKAEELIPMPLDQAVMDWLEIPSGDRQGEPTETTEVVVVAARRDMIEKLVQATRQAGLRPVGIDHSAFALIRALAAESSADPSWGTLYCNFGDTTNIAIARGSSCLFTRVAGFGVEGIAQSLAERRGLTLKHSRQWLGHVGLVQPIAAIEGDAQIIASAREVLIEGAGRLADELRVSLEYYRAQEDAVHVESIVTAGPGTTIPGLIDHLRTELGLAISVGRPSALGELEPGLAARLVLPFGLGLES